MEKISLFFQDANFDLKSELVDKYLAKVSDELKNNPIFMNQLYQAISYLTRKRSMSDKIPPMELYVADDGKSFEIRSGIRPDPDCNNELLMNNKCFETIKFSKDEKDNMDVTVLSGTFYKFDDYKKNFGGDDVNHVFSNLTSNETPTVISVNHRNTGFLKSGIEVCRSTYSDKYPLGITMNDELEMKIQTAIHSPTKWYFNLVPDKARYEAYPLRSNAHRFINDLGAVTFLVSSGRDAPVRAMDFASGTEYPERIGGSPIPFAKYEDEKTIIYPEYEEMYPGKSEQEIRKEINLSFYKGLETSKTKESNPEIYENLKKLVEDGLATKYGINQNEEELTSNLSR